jgi:DNA-directed RNA polymerase I, II, and III subunit RPABC2
MKGGLKLLLSKNNDGFEPVYEMIMNDKSNFKLMTASSLSGFIFTLEVPEDVSRYADINSDKTGFDKIITNFVIKIVLIADEDDDYLQKLDEHVRTKVIENHHPELKTLNYEEVEALATVIRDKNNIIIDALHRTLPILTRYEKARILGERAKQINSGAKPMIDVEPTLIDGYLIALKELEQKRIPFIIQRPLPNGGSEYWRVADLE